MLNYVIKRDGTRVDFDETKIINAISKANKAADDDDMNATELLFLCEKVCKLIEERALHSVEAIQDMVEETLIRYDHAQTAKAYILYRAEHTKIRNAESYLMDIYEKLTWSPAADEDLKRENANIDGDTAMGTMLKYGSEGAKYFIDNYVLPKDISAAHLNGDIHIHDKDFYLLTETCCQIDLIPLFKNGFSTGHGYLREPNSIESYSALACIAVQANQNEMHGGQSLPNFDYAMAPGVKKTFRKEYRTALIDYFTIQQRWPVEEAQALDEFVKPLLATSCSLSSLEQCLAVLEKYCDASVQPLLKDAHAYASQKALQISERRTYQAMEALIHNLNTMNSRAGAQVPFSSINYGTDTSPEGQMVVRNLLKATTAGLGNGETPIFPVQIFKVKEGVNFNPEDPNYALFQLAIETTAMRLFPNFSFLDAPFNLQYYKAGDYNSEVAYMGCRTRVLGNTHDPERQVTCGRGNLSFTSLNLPRLGIEAKGNIETFFSLLDEKIDMIFRQLLHRLKIQSNKKVRNYPFLMGEGIWIDSANLDWDDTIGEVLKHGTLSMGFIGLAETLVALTGEHHGQSAKAQELGLSIIKYIRKKADDASTESGLNFSIIATPAESLSGRFVGIDKTKYGIIPGVTDKDYYTNSFHIPVAFPISIHEKIQLEAPYHTFTNAGHITYVELDGDTCDNPQAVEAIIRYMQSQGVGYGSINHPLDRDPVCGYIGVIKDVCPRCGRREGEGVSQDKLFSLKRQYPNMPHWRN